MAKKLQSGDKRLGAGKKLLRACFCVILLEIALAALFFFWERVKQKESSENQITVDLNEIIHQVESGETKPGKTEKSGKRYRRGADTVVSDPLLRRVYPDYHRNRRLCLSAYSASVRSTAGLCRTGCYRQSGCDAS